MPQSYQDDLLHSNFIVLWGLNVAENIWGTHTGFHLLRAKEKGIRSSTSIRGSPIREPCLPLSGSLSGRAQIRPCSLPWPMSLSGTAWKIELSWRSTRLVSNDSGTISLEGGRHRKESPVGPAVTGVSAGVIERLALDYGQQSLRPFFPRLRPEGRPSANSFTERGQRFLSHGKHRDSRGKPGLLRHPCRRRLPGAQHAFLAVPDSHRCESGGEGRGFGGISPELRGQKRLQGAQFEAVDSILEGRKGGYPGDFKFFYVTCANPLNQLSQHEQGSEGLKASISSSSRTNSSTPRPGSPISSCRRPRTGKGTITCVPGSAEITISLVTRLLSPWRNEIGLSNRL